MNGLPLVIIELKSPANASADLNTAIDPLGRYKKTPPYLCVPNMLLVVRDGLLTRVKGTYADVDAPIESAEFSWSPSGAEN